MPLKKLTKLFGLASRPHLLKLLLQHRVAAGVEHLDVVRHVRPKSLLDIGANKGQFSLITRYLIPDVQIIAFEPLPSAAAIYDRIFCGEPDVELHRLAIADERKESTFHVTDRTDSSSLLEPGHGQRSAFGISAAERITVQVDQLTAIVEPTKLKSPVLMKIDVQGSELAVLKGSKEILPNVDFVYVEASYTELYLKQALFDDVDVFLRANGFHLKGVFNQSITEAFGPTQADFLYARVHQDSCSTNF